jgi:cbb3-type cytochrome c oxidase subunit III
VEARDIAVIILVVGLVGFAVAYFTVGPGRHRGPRPAGDIPLAMRPYHSDEELEGAGIERAMAWGAVLVLFMALFLPVYWLMEPGRIQAKQAEFWEQDVDRGRVEYAEACAECHGADARGGFAPHPDPEVDAAWPAPSLHDVIVRYDENPNIIEPEEYLEEQIRQGRPGTPMPAWSAEHGGGMVDQQIESIVRYLLAIQEPEEPEPEAHAGETGEQVFAQNCARCHGAAAQGDVAPPLTEVFARYGAPAGERDEGAEAAVRSIIENGVIVPAGADMPRWEGKITDDAIDRVIDYLWTIQENGVEENGG